MWMKLPLLKALLSSTNRNISGHHDVEVQLKAAIYFSEFVSHGKLYPIFNIKSSIKHIYTHTYIFMINISL